MMDGGRHWTENDLMERAYGLDPAPGLTLEHLKECPECAGEWKRMREARAGVVAAAAGAECGDERLRAQRAEVWRRIERPARWRALPVAATCAVLLLAVALNRPAPQAVNPEMAVAVSDEQLFTEIANVVNTDSPRAVEPIRGLFNEANGVEAQ